MRLLANRPFGSDYEKSGVRALWCLFSCGFPDASVRHGCLCTLLFLRRQSSLGMDAYGLVQFIHVTSAGVFSDTHTSDKYSPYCSDHILLSGFGVSGMPDIPKLSAGQGLSSLTMNRSNHPRHSSREVFVGTRKRHHGRVGLAGMLSHHLLIALWLHV